MYRLLIKQFIRSRTTFLAFGILILLGGLAINTGKQFLNQKKAATEKAVQTQKEHIEQQVELHQDDLGLLMYYLKFSYINNLQPITGISIGQSDLNTHIQNIGILNLESQKYDTELVNPMKTQVGNLDLSFLLIFLYPLIIIALTFNLLSEEVERETWKLIKIQGKSPILFLLKKLSIRLALVAFSWIILLVLAKLILGIPLHQNFFNFIVISFLYLAFWFSFCLFVISLNYSSNNNAIILLASWLILVVFLPVIANNYVINKYPIGEAFSLSIKQRDGYHKKWDTDKTATMNKFYAHYPQFEKYGVQEEGFSWLWYYAMQQMGDDESKNEQEEMYEKLKQRESLSKTISQYFPPMQIQLSLNDIAKTSLSHHVEFLNATTAFHEELRLNFYPPIFDGKTPEVINWKEKEVRFFDSKQSISLFKVSFPILFSTLILFGFSFINWRRIRK